MGKYEIREIKGGLPKGIKMAFVPLAQLEMLLERQSDLHLSEGELDTKDLVSSLAVEMWRLEKRVDSAKANMPKESITTDQAVLDQVQRVKDVFKKHDIEIHEHTGISYNDGLSLKVLHVEEMDSIPKGKMQIIETVKPSIYFKGQVVFHGEVIVGKAKE